MNRIIKIGMDVHSKNYTLCAILNIRLVLIKTKYEVLYFYLMCIIIIKLIRVLIYKHSYVKKIVSKIC